MKHKVLLFFFSLFLVPLCFAGPVEDKIPHGAELSRQIQKNFEKNGLKTEKLPLVSSSQKDFPFNISLKFPGSPETDSIAKESVRKTLLFILSQEESFRKSDFYTNLLLKLSAEKLNYDITFLLIPPDKGEFSDFHTVSGESAFLGSLENKEDYSVVFLQTESDKTRVIPGSGNYISPSWLIRHTYDSINQTRLLSSFKVCYISFLYKQNLFHIPVLEDFISQGIPSILIQTDKNLEDSQLSDFILEFCRSYDLKETIQEDTHSIMVTLFHHSFWINEGTITKMILYVIFLTFMLLILYGLLNYNLGLKSWKKIRKIWFYPLIIYSVSLGIFYSYRHILVNMEMKGIILSFSSSICFILPFIFTVIAFFFFSILRSAPYFHRRTVDYLTLFTASLNLILFSLIDISLFPLFGIEFILAWISTLLTFNIVHFLILTLFEIPFLPFIMQIFTNSTPEVLNSIFKDNSWFPPALFLMLLPQYLNSFRVFTGMNFYWFFKNRSKQKKEKNNLYFLAILLICFELILFFLIPSSYKEINTRHEAQITEAPEKFLHAKIDSQKIFEENLNFLNITSDKDLQYCDVRIQGTDGVPVLFSDNNYIVENSTTVVFPLPYQPPCKLDFSYGSSQNQEYSIIITGIYSENGVYYRQIIKLFSKSE